MFKKLDLSSALEAASKKLTEAASTVATEIGKAIPAQFSSEKRFVNAYALIIALLINAEEENKNNKNTILSIIENDPYLQERKLVTDVLNSSLIFINEFDAIKNKATSQTAKTLELTVRVNNILEDNLEPEHKLYLIGFITNIVGDRSTPAETEVKNTVVKLLSKGNKKG